MSELDQFQWNTVEHRNGVDWFAAPSPRFRVLHQHRWQTRVQYREKYWYERCRCGAHQWTDLPGWLPDK